MRLGGLQGSLHLSARGDVNGHVDRSGHLALGVPHRFDSHEKHAAGPCKLVVCRLAFEATHRGGQWRGLGILRLEILRQAHSDGLRRVESQRSRTGPERCGEVQVLISRPNCRRDLVPQQPQLGFAGPKNLHQPLPLQCLAFKISDKLWNFFYFEQELSFCFFSFWHMQPVDTTANPLILG